MEKLTSSIQGLKWIPTLGDFEDNSDRDSSRFSYNYMGQEFSENDQKALLQEFNNIKERCKCILEIGVCRSDYLKTSTSVFLENKLDSCFYIGIDLDDRNFLNNSSKNIYTLKENSFNRAKTMEFLNSLGVDKIDFLFIDGWHSIKAVLNDWQYTERLSEFGVVGFHDTNFHPGPYFIFDAIDEKMYKKNKYFEVNDWGISFAKR